MGGSQSTRQIEVSPQNTVMITKDVQKRLLGLQENSSNREDGRRGTAELSAEEKDALRLQIENECRQRISEQSVNIQAEEFARAVQQVEAKFIKQSGGPVCQDLQQQVYECYQNHLKEPLNCSTQVKAFTEAVEKARRNAVMVRQT